MKLLQKKTGLFLLAISPMVFVFCSAMALTFVPLGLPYIHLWFSPLFHTLGGFATAWTLVMGVHFFGPWGVFQLHKRLIILFYIALVSLVGVVWEFAEFVLDEALGWNWQPSLADTISDLALDLVGGLIFLIIYGYYWKRHILLDKKL